MRRLGRRGLALVVVLSLRSADACRARRVLPDPCRNAARLAAARPLALPCRSSSSWSRSSLGRSRLDVLLALCSTKRCGNSRSARCRTRRKLATDEETKEKLRTRRTLQGSTVLCYDKESMARCSNRL